MVERLTEIWKASDGTYHDTKAKAEYHEEVVVMRGAVSRMRDWAKYHHNIRVCTSGIEKALEHHGFVYCHDKDKSVGEEGKWGGSNSIYDEE